MPSTRAIRRTIEKAIDAILVGSAPSPVRNEIIEGLREMLAANEIPPVKKLVVDGEVAVIYSPGYGSGWASYLSGDEAEAALFDKVLAQAIIDNDLDLVKQIARDWYPDVYLPSPADLQVHWVPQGTRFEILEYDGSERIRIFKDDDGFVA